MFGNLLLKDTHNEATEKLFAEEPAAKRAKVSDGGEEKKTTTKPASEEGGAGAMTRRKKVVRDVAGETAVQKALEAAAKMLNISVKSVLQEQAPRKKEPAAQRKRRRARSELDRERSTVFVGNVAVGTTLKELKRLFEEKCNADVPADAPAEERAAVESVRLRGAAYVRKGKEPVYLAARRGAYDSARDTLNAYVVFTSVRGAEKAVRAVNNTVFKDRHLRVDLADEPIKSVKKSVFVGNVPFDVKEEDLRHHFDDCGDVVGVRVVRNKDAHLGKGFAFVAFADRASVTAALLKNDSDFQGRKLRVTKCLDESVAKDVVAKEKKKRRDADKKAYQAALQRGEHPRMPRSLLPEPRIKRSISHGLTAASLSSSSSASASSSASSSASTTRATSGRGGKFTAGRGRAGGGRGGSRAGGSRSGKVPAPPRGRGNRPAAPLRGASATFAAAAPLKKKLLKKK